MVYCASAPERACGAIGPNFGISLFVVKLVQVVVYLSKAESVTALELKTKAFEDELKRKEERKRVAA